MRRQIGEFAEPRIGGQRPTHARLLILVASALILAACDKSGHVQALAAPAAVVTVNGTAITSAQVDQAMGRSPMLGVSDHPWPTTPAVLDELIAQELILQKAREAKVDRDPEVMQATESARRAVLVNAWLHSAAGVVPVPTKQEIEDYLHKHPELAAGRRFFSWRSASLRASAAQIADIQQQVANTKNFDDLLAYLDANNLRYVKSQQTAPSEQLSAEALKKFSAIHSGDTAMFANGDHVELLQLMSDYPAPTDEGPIRPVIERILREQRTKDAIEARMALLRAGARIELVGDFKALAPIQPNAAASQPEANDVNQGIAKGLR